MNETFGTNLDRRLCVAPMMDCTDRHFRYFLRLITRNTLLYTEMITAAAILNGNRERLLGFDPRERPLALQVGGSDPGALAQCTRIAAARGYDEVNLNVCCPSDRVRSGRFGACLMAEPERVAACVAAMRSAGPLPVTVKTRIGIDNRDSDADLAAFVATVAAAGCDVFIFHARKAWLEGLSPKENREIPPLDYGRVARLKANFPKLEIIVNGGIRNLDDAAEKLTRFDGAMLGRAAYSNPYLLVEADRRFFGETNPPPSRRDIIMSLLPYVDAELTRGTALKHISRHILGLFQACRGARRWRRYLSEHAHRPGAGSEVICAALPTGH
jgi:tRNA-dihydrouridine synthase A